ncbi:hypothetical protein E4U32_000751 [Claviceps aff. humidiphila group G2b]|nr:hypothetical protein E4U32_000751 [Claviceps aff. humidiphila group G2b]
MSFQRRTGPRSDSVSGEKYGDAVGEEAKLGVQILFDDLKHPQDPRFQPLHFALPKNHILQLMNLYWSRYPQRHMRTWTQQYAASHRAVATPRDPYTISSTLIPCMDLDEMDFDMMDVNEMDVDVMDVDVMDVDVMDVVEMDFDEMDFDEMDFDMMDVNEMDFDMMDFVELDFVEMDFDMMDVNEMDFDMMDVVEMDFDNLMYSWKLSRRERNERVYELTAWESTVVGISNPADLLCFLAQVSDHCRR